MYPSVKARFRACMEESEGAIAYMYLDIKGLVTVGVGNLVEPVEQALSLPFRFKNKPGLAKRGTLATRDEIKEEWTRIKQEQSLATKGARACEDKTNLELSDDDLNALIAARCDANEKFLKRRKQFKDFDNWPADAQMGVLAMAWGMGAAGFDKFPQFSAACERMDFVAAASQCKISETGNPGVAVRNRADKAMFLNAAAVLATETVGLQRSVLYYPWPVYLPWITVIPIFHLPENWRPTIT